VSYLINVSRLKGSSNLGGVIEILVARKDDVLAIPEPVNGFVIGDISFPVGSGFYTWAATQESATIKSTSRQSREGSSKANRLPFRLPIDLYNTRNMLEQAEDDEFIVLFKYPNGKRKLFGDLDRPVKFRFDHDSGQGYADGNFFSCEFYYDGPQNILFYSGAIPTPTPGTGSARVEYTNGDLIALVNPSDVLVLSSPFAHSFQLIPGPGGIAVPAIVKWDDEEIIAQLQPGDVLQVDTAFDFTFEIIEPV
jgi:hypothetical protein